jgi:putative toxin-antitoxin system antitoxin component (TIGR02293 family)
MAKCRYNHGMLQRETATAPVETLFSRLAGRLGVPKIRSNMDLAEIEEGRLPVESIESLISSGLSDGEIYSLILPRRTLAHRVANRQPLSVEESGRAVRVARAVSLAEQVFGEPRRAWKWMRAAKRRFGNKSPMQMLGTEQGARSVEEALLQLDHGIFA